MRFRLFVLGLGALLVIATFTFSYWYPLLLNTGESVLFPEIDSALWEPFAELPPDRQADYLAMRSADMAQALDMVNSALQPDVVVPEEAQATPEVSAQTPVLTGEFVGITPNRSAEGTATIYELPDGSRYLWLQDFRAIQGPDVRVYLSTQETLDLEELDEDEELGLSADDIPLGRLEANVGSQQFPVPSEPNLTLYNSIILYSQRLSLVYAIADLAVPE
jgi:hypothetical protein